MSGAAASLAALLLIASLITIHEFGHFLVAKACGVRVRVFSVGIGGRLFGFRHGDTDYRVSWLPFGGYVRMAGADPFLDGGTDEDEDPRAEGAFMSKPAWQRLLIVLAGPAMNLVLPFVVFTALKVTGEPQPVSRVGTVLEASAAEQAGILPEDRIVSVNGTSTRTWPDVMEAFEASTGDSLALAIERDGATRSVVLPVAGVEIGALRDPYDFGVLNSAPDAEIGVDDPASPAGKAGLRAGDVIRSVGDQEVANWNEVRRQLATAEGRPVSVEVAREGDAAPLRVELVPDPAWAPAPTAADDATYAAWGLASASVFVGDFGGADSAARDAGVEPGDRLLAVDGAPVHRWQDVVGAVGAAAEGEGSAQTARPLELQVRRGGQTRTFTVTPRVIRDTDALGRYRWRPLLGIASGGATVAAPPVLRPYPLGDAFVRAGEETFLIGNFMVEQIGKMVTGEAPPQENLGGPVAMFNETRAAAERGLHDWVRQLGLFSLSLGIINLLPIPVLDGGQIVMYLAEWVRGRPLPLVLRERAQQAGVIFLVLLMLFVFANDIRRWVESV